MQIESSIGRVDKHNSNLAQKSWKVDNSAKWLKKITNPGKIILKFARLFRIGLTPGSLTQKGFPNIKPRPYTKRPFYITKQH